MVSYNMTTRFSSLLFIDITRRSQIRYRCLISGTPWGLYRNFILSFQYKKNPRYRYLADNFSFRQQEREKNNVQYLMFLSWSHIRGPYISYYKLPYFIVKVCREPQKRLFFNKLKFILFINEKYMCIPSGISCIN